MKFPYKTYWLLGISFITLYFTFYFTKANRLQKQSIYSKIDTLQVPFVSNQGQWHKEILYSAQTFAGNFFIDSNHHLVYNIVKSEKPNSSKKNLSGIILKEILLNTNSLSIKPQNPSTAKVNYFKGNNPKQWISNIPTYHSISYGEIYPNIELQLKAYSKNIEKLFLIKPHAQIENIKIKVEGIKDLKINEKGQLVLSTSLGEVLFTKPKGYYQDQIEQEIEVSYVVYNKDEYGFKIKDYDQSRTIVIDPLLASTYLGGSDWDQVNSLAMDSSGNVFITGYTESNNFPTTTGAYDTTFNNNYDVFVAKFDPNLSSGSGSNGSNNDLLGLLLLINKKKKQCFIATATYGTPMAEEVQILRDFRDKYLITNLPGQIFVYLYYQISPPIAKLIENNETLKTISRIVLTPIIYSIKYPNIALFLFSSSFLGLFFSFLVDKKYTKQ
jgi:hypothetical protein